jgi:hypothetical protein
MGVACSNRERVDLNKRQLPIVSHFKLIDHTLQLLKKWSFNEIENPPESCLELNNYVSESCWGYTYSFLDIFIYSGCGMFCCSYKDIKKGILWCLKNKIASLHFDKIEMVKIKPSHMDGETEEYFKILNTYQSILTLRNTLHILPLEIETEIIDFYLDDKHMREIFI